MNDDANLLKNLDEGINTGVVDAVMGSGKTTAIINYINKTKRPIIILVERQSEVDRISKSCQELISLSDVSNDTGITRTQALEEVTETGLSVVSTHQLMKRWTNKFLLSVEHFGYELIIDETLSGVLSPVKVSASDLRQFLDNGQIERKAGSKLNKVTIGKSLPSKYESLEATIQNKDCYLYDLYQVKEDREKYCLIEAPRADLFEVFKKITVLTYLFDGSLLRSYFDLHSIGYEKFSVVDSAIVEHIPRDGSAFKDKVIIYDGKLNHFHATRRRSNFNLSSSWCEKPENQKKSARALRNLVTHWKASGCIFESFAYTIPKDYQEKIHSSHTGSTKLNRRYHDSTIRTSMSDLEKKSVTFIPQTIRGTNEFSHKRFMAYLPNTFMNPLIEGFLKEHELVADEETFALSQMVQWLWRGCIRNDEVMHVFIPSRRMRMLFMTWLGYSNEELF